MDSHINRMKDFLGEDQCMDVRFIGICGMSGIGKTTIAKDIYAKMLWKFDVCCFLENVKEKFKKGEIKDLLKDILFKLTRKKEEVCKINFGVVEIRRCMKNKKMLLIIDDVDDLKQLELLAGETNWFGLGSKVIITCEDRHLLSVHGVYGTYQVDFLSKDQARVLLSRRAFKQDQPQKTFKRVTELILDYANSHPLALSVLGSFLCGRSLIQWQDAINMLDEIWVDKIINMLQISVNGLRTTEKKIFLDVACCLSGERKNWAIRILDACGFHANLGVQILIEKSLLSESKGRLQMHELLRRTGRVIVERESSNPGERSRLWDLEKDIAPMLESGKGYTSRIEVIFAGHHRLDGSDLYELKSQNYLSSFRTMRNLRILSLKNVRVPKQPSHLSDELRFLRWDKYPGLVLPYNFNPSKLSELHLSNSMLYWLHPPWVDLDQLKRLRRWKIAGNFNSLKVLNLQFSNQLWATPDFRCMPDLEELILCGCTKLSEIHPSFQTLKKLIRLDMRNCVNLEKFSISCIHEMQSLQTLYLQGCKELQKIDIQGVMPKLVSLDLSETKIESLSNSTIQNLPRLISLGLKDCENLGSLPISIFGLKELEDVKLSGRWNVDALVTHVGLGRDWRISS